MKEQHNGYGFMYIDYMKVGKLLARRNISQITLASIMAKLRGRETITAVDSERRFISRVLKDQNRVKKENAERLAKALGIPLSEIIIIDPNDDDMDIPTVLDEISRCDKAMEFERAIQLSTLLIKQLEQNLRKDHIPNFYYAQAYTLLGTVYEHNKDWEQGISLLNHMLEQDIFKSIEFSDQRLRALYHRSILYRKWLGELLDLTAWKLPANVIEEFINTCKKDLNQVNSLANESMKISVTHQFGILTRIQGDYANAKKLFEDALKRRKKIIQAYPNLEENFRLAYEYRAIAKCCAHLGQDPMPDWKKAYEIAQEEKHARLINELTHDKPALLAMYNKHPQEFIVNSAD